MAAIADTTFLHSHDDMPLQLLLFELILLENIPGGGHSNVMELLMLVNQPRKWTLNGVIHTMVLATLNGVI